MLVSQTASRTWQFKLLPLGRLLTCSSFITLVLLNVYCLHVGTVLPPARLLYPPFRMCVCVCVCVCVSNTRRVKRDVGLFFFDNTYRPCPLAQQYIGINIKKPLQRFQLMNEICYQKVLDCAGRHQVGRNLCYRASLDSPHLHNSLALSSDRI